MPVKFTSLLTAIVLSIVFIFSVPVSAAPAASNNADDYDSTAVTKVMEKNKPKFSESQGSYTYRRCFRQYTF